MPNVFRPDIAYDADDPPGFRCGRDRVGRAAGATALGASVYLLPPGEAVCPYHWHAIEEELLIVLGGAPSLRTPDGWRELSPGDVVAFPTGEAGAHLVANRSAEEARVLLVSEMAATEVCGYPDSGKIGVFGPNRALFREADAVDYWQGESPPGA